MRNPVAKNLNKFNRASTQRDKKKDFKRGRDKHRQNKYGNRYEN